MGALEASRGMETVLVASRAVPVLGPTAEQGVRAAMTDPGTRAAMANQGTPWAVADPGIRAAMADQGTSWAMTGSPPQKKFLGKSRTSGGGGGGRSGGALWRRGRLWVLWRRRCQGALRKRGR